MSDTGALPVIARCVPLLAVLVISLVEILIADRKFGIFTGGFGQSQAITQPLDYLSFAVGYLLSQATAALLLWELVGTFHRRHMGWPRRFQFTALFAGGYTAALVISYQLHSYFSDAVSFTLIKQLGGGSIVDALLFGLNELMSGVVMLSVTIALWIVGWRLMVRRYGLTTATSPDRLGWVRLLSVFGLLAVSIIIIGRISPNAAFGLDRTIAWSTIRQGLDAATDFDRDGYGLFGRNRDSHPFDPSRHPLALDIPGDGIDQDGYGGDLRLVEVPLPRALTHVPAHGPNVVMVMMESTRADVLGKRIDGRAVAPNLEALAREGTAIIPSFSHVAFTTASLKSIFSGALAPLPGAPSLFRELKQSGYRVGVYSGQAESFGDISATVGMKENADHFVDAEVLKTQRAFSFAAQGSLLIDEKVVLDRFDRDYRAAGTWDRPSFLYFNFQSPHFPYDHPGVPHRFVNQPIGRDSIGLGQRDLLQRTYWNAVAQADASLGRLIASLKRAGQWERTVMLVSGDHGESLFEDGFLGHGHIINRRQFATFMVVNRRGISRQAPIAISDYRGILLDVLTGHGRSQPAALPPFLHIGPLDAPTEIGLVTPAHGIIRIRLDTGATCFERPAHCASYADLAPRDRSLADQVVNRWGSERWAVSRGQRAVQN